MRSCSGGDDVREGGFAPVAGGDDGAASVSGFVDGAAERFQDVEGFWRKPECVFGVGVEGDVLLEVVEGQENGVRGVDLLEEVEELAAEFQALVVERLESCVETVLGTQGGEEGFLVELAVHDDAAELAATALDTVTEAGGEAGFAEASHAPNDDSGVLGFGGESGEGPLERAAAADEALEAGYFEFLLFIEEAFIGANGLVLDPVWRGFDRYQGCGGVELGGEETQKVPIRNLEGLAGTWEGELRGKRG